MERLLHLRRVAPAALLGLGIAGLAAPGARPPAAERLSVANPAVSHRGSHVFFHGRPFTGTLVALTAAGRVAEERSYRGGLAHGLHRGWWDGSLPRFEYRFERGLLEGEALEWDAGGRLYRSATYHRGHEEGAQKMWNADRILRANYVVRSGRRFGFIGATGCAGGDSARGRTNAVASAR